MKGKLTPVAMYTSSFTLSRYRGLTCCQSLNAFLCIFPAFCQFVTHRLWSSIKPRFSIDHLWIEFREDTLHHRHCWPTVICERKNVFAVFANWHFWSEQDLEDRFHMHSVHTHPVVRFQMHPSPVVRHQPDVWQETAPTSSWFQITLLQKYTNCPDCYLVTPRGFFCH